MSEFTTDVREWRSPTMKEIRALISALGRRRLSVPQFQKEVLRVYREGNLWKQLRPWIGDCLTGRCDVILWREVMATRNFTLQLL